jgi:hypothetical protein
MVGEAICDLEEQRGGHCASVSAVVVFRDCLAAFLCKPSHDARFGRSGRLMPITDIGVETVLRCVCVAKCLEHYRIVTVLSFGRFAFCGVDWKLNGLIGHGVGSLMVGREDVGGCRWMSVVKSD